MRKRVRYQRWRRRRAILRDPFNFEDDDDCDFGLPLDEKAETPPLEMT